ncbi:DMT family transporter [Roseibium algicola]|uniref:DMT family transporter n=1 Tax=Roseibium algicola TaxID=2857014 RepID=UPI00345A911B
MRQAIQKDTTAAIAALVFATLFWSGNFIAGRAIRGEITPLELNTIRWGLCLAMMLPFTLRGLVSYRRELVASWRVVALLGITGIAAFHTMVYQALSQTAAVNCLLILALAPVATVGGGMIWSGFRPTLFQIAGLLVSLLGASVLVLAGGTVGVSLLQVDTGKVWMLGAILIWAWYTLLLRQKPSAVPQSVTLVASILVALCVMAAFLLVRGVERPEFTEESLLAVAYIAVFASAIGFLLWSYGIGIIGPERGGQFVHLMPIFGSILAVLLLGEQLTFSLLAGAAFVVAGIVLVNR